MSGSRRELVSMWETCLSDSLAINSPVAVFLGSELHPSAFEV
jgi:hypothetical protein